MTKMKSKKMTKSTFAIIIMAIAIVALLAFGGSYAYFTATGAAQSGNFTTGTVKLTSNGSFTTVATAVMPKDYILGTKDNSESVPAATLTVETNDVNGNYVAIKFEISGKKADGTTPLTAEELQAAGLNIVPAAGWARTAADANTFVWAGAGVQTVGADAVAVAAGSTAVADMETITLNVFTTGLQFDATANWAQGDTTQPALMGAQITITLTSASIQASGFADAAAAKTELLTKLA